MKYMASESPVRNQRTPARAQRRGEFHGGAGARHVHSVGGRDSRTLTDSRQPTTMRGPMVPRFVSTNSKGGAMKTRRFQGPILGPPDRIIIRLGHVRNVRISGRKKEGRPYELGTSHCNRDRRFRNCKGDSR